MWHPIPTYSPTRSARASRWSQRPTRQQRSASARACAAAFAVRVRLPSSRSIAPRLERWPPHRQAKMAIAGASRVIAVTSARLRSPPRQETSACTANLSSTTASRCRPRRRRRPRRRAREVLLRVSHCGVCHSDIHLQDGYFDLGGGQKLDVRGNRPLPFTLGHEIAGTVEAAGPDAQGVGQGQALRRLSLDRLRQVRAVRARRRAPVQRAPRARRHRRRRLRHARAGAASALPARRGGHRARDRRRPDVLRPHRLRRRQEGRCPICAPAR